MTTVAAGRGNETGEEKSRTAPGCDAGGSIPNRARISRVNCTVRRTILGQKKPGHATCDLRRCAATSEVITRARTSEGTSTWCSFRRQGRVIGVVRLTARDGGCWTPARWPYFSPVQWTGRLFFVTRLCGRWRTPLEFAAGGFPPTLASIRGAKPRFGRVALAAVKGKVHP